MPAKFRHPSNGYTETVSDRAWLWVLLFGLVYFAVHGVWRHFVASLILALLTGGLSWLVYPFFAGGIMRTHYLRMGWARVGRKKRSLDGHDLGRNSSRRSVTPYSP